MPRKKALPVKQQVETMSEHRIARSKERIEESRLLMENSRVTRLASITSFTAKTKRRAAGAKSKQVEAAKHDGR
jgi:hypothetical protein